MFRCFVICLIALFALPASAQYNIKKLMEEGRRTLDQGYYVASLQIFDRIVALKPNLYEAWYLMALSKYHLEDYKGADEDCLEALKLQPYIADIFELYGMTCIREEKYDSAIVAYTKALDINSDNQEFWFNRAYSFYMNQNKEEASKQLAYILNRWPKFEAARLLDEEIRSGRKQKRKPVQSAKVDMMKLSSLSRGSWLMQRMPKEDSKNAPNPSKEGELKIKHDLIKLY